MRMSVDLPARPLELVLIHWHVASPSVRLSLEALRLQVLETMADVLHRFFLSLSRSVLRAKLSLRVGAGPGSRIIESHRDESRYGCHRQVWP